MRHFALSLVLLCLVVPAVAQDAPAPAPQVASTAQPTSTPPATDTATVYIYRLPDHYAAIDKPMVTCDQKDLLRIHRDTVFTLHLPPGPHVLASNAKDNQLMIDAKAGEVYYVWVKMTAADGFHQPKGFLSIIPPDQLNKKFKTLKPAVVEETNSAAAQQP